MSRSTDAERVDAAAGIELRALDVAPGLQRHLEELIGVGAAVDPSLLQRRRSSSSTSNAQRLWNGVASAARSVSLTRKTLAPHWVS